MITTIQIRDNVKAELDRLKNSNNKTYEDVILYLVQLREKMKRKQEELLIEGYKEMAEESLKINKEFEAIEENFDWEWK
jgi:predicted CopG family antitoxin